MIVDSSYNDNMKDSPVQSTAQPLLDSPPSYDYATESTYDAPKFPKPNQPLLIAGRNPGAGPSYVTQPQGTPAPTIYNYVNPITGEQVASLLPPDHPEMICLQEGSHVPHTQYGFLGIMAAVFWFPLGIALCLLDRKVRCRRCGLVIENGVCG